MRINEILKEQVSQQDASLITALTLLQRRADEAGSSPTLSTQSLINMIKNTDQSFSYDALINAQESNPAVKNLIKSFNKDQVTLNPLNSYEDEIVGAEGSGGGPDTVGNMAKSASKARKPDLF